ncbi:hypothetical protein [Delftia phage PhiW-14]|uniref:Uncharacterized protein n=1 Tax=Delftia phage PhiW-14 TaxID=665032 RepID=C9DGE4_BPW14|nr:hypothetical protein DP-phiW-14_gp174 [Delftia phage PhiW-14]ACV50195.1 hypothetical protein [Delftia phage PhiW-14]
MTRFYDPSRDHDLFGLAITHLTKAEKFNHLNRAYDSQTFTNIFAAISFAACRANLPDAFVLTERFHRAMLREMNQGRTVPMLKPFRKARFHWSIETWLREHSRDARGLYHMYGLSDFSRHPKVLEYKLAWLIHLSEKYRKGDLRV